MLEVRRDLDLGEEALGAHHCGQLRLQDLEGYPTLVLDVVGQENRGHAAFAELVLDGVPALDGDGAHGRGSTITLGETRSNMAADMHLT